MHAVDGSFVWEMERRKYYFRERSRDNNGRGETERASTRERQRQKDKNPSVISSPRKETGWRERPRRLQLATSAATLPRTAFHIRLNEYSVQHASSCL